ncbi:hypothetical protein HYH03_009026 [Edaphochlamys debaryana]|uniref:Leucine zipper transcription factor-like protein 1 n=1 Tax=Edaphochlamys debaryana TaxID=47281 RepID=A0A836BXJ4_9CHLO|nr:hypothetical protein HYH03_009026 [Edaphochlamys debaryana]|eukprot:KAG2492610.1 hypothetical protein HYH03_009026 [Edaphochlamys debaryana]
MAKLQEEVTKVMRDRTEINNKLNTLKDELAARGIQLSDKDASLSKLRKDLDSLSTNRAGLSAAEAERLQKQAGGLAGQLAALQDEVKGLKSQLALKDKELRAANDALNGKLQDSKQFQQMKAMMQAKAQEVAQLRKRLERYEPQNVPSADKE